MSARNGLVVAMVAGCVGMMAAGAFGQAVDADSTLANRYDDAWEVGPDGWVAAQRMRRAMFKGTPGFALHVGDSITYASPYGQWARSGGGKTASDKAICEYVRAGLWGDGSNDVKSGFYLAAYDHKVPSGGTRGFTGIGGIRTDQWLEHQVHTGNASIDDMFTPGYTNPDGVQYRDAEMCLVMLGTNDAHAKRPTPAMIADLARIAEKIQANHTIVILSTLPPDRHYPEAIESYNKAIRNLARKMKLPLIDYYAEIVRRRPGTTWDGTLMSQDGVHPSARHAEYTTASDPYAEGGKAMSHSGYLLRCWLTIQKFKEIKAKVIDPVTSGAATRPTVQ